MIRNTVITLITLLLWTPVQFSTSNMSPWSGIGAALLLTLNAIACGRLLIKSSKSSIPTDRFILNLALGLPVIALLALLTGKIWLSYTVILPYLALPGTWYALNSIISSLKEYWITEHQKIHRSAIVPGLISTVTLLFLLSASLCPPTGWDELTYHLTVPVRWLTDRNITTYMDNPFSALPSECEILFALLISKGGLMAPRLLNWILLTTIFFGLWKLLMKWLRPFSAWCFSMAFLLSPVILLLFKETYAETLIVFLLIALLHLIHRYSLHKRAPAAMALAGMIGGAMLAAKPTGIVIVFFAMVMLLLKLRHKNRSIKISITTFLIGCFVITVPFYLRTWIQTGLPVFPFGAQWFTADPSIINTAIYHKAAAIEKYGDHNPLAFFLNLFRLSYNNKLFGPSIGWQFILILAALVLQVILQKKSRRYEYLWYPTGTFLCYCVWFFTAQQSRFFTPYFILMLVGATISLTGTKKLEKYCGIIILTLSLISLPGIMLRHFYNCWKYPVGKVKYNDYVYSLTGNGYLPAIDTIKKATPENAKILLMFDPRGLYIPRRHEICTPFFQSKYFTEGSSFNDLLKQAKQDIPYYILFCSPEKIPARYPDYMTPIQPFLAQLQQAINSGKAKTVWNYNGYALIKLFP